MNIETRQPIQRVKNFIYNLKDKIGQGAGGKVYKGVNQQNGQCVAIKVLEMGEIDNEVTQYLLACEKQALSSISSPFVLSAYDIIQTEQQCFIITPFCNGGTLKNYIKSKGKLNEHEAIQIFTKILKGYLAIQEKGFIHRDLKSHNVMFRNGQPVIIDFGYCEKIKGNKPKIFYNVGSPSYMSPQAYFKTIYSEKSDVWALGVLLYQMLEGHTIDQGLQIQRYFAILAKQGFVLKSQISDETKKMLNAILSQNPQNRPTAEFLIQKIEKSILQKLESLKKQQLVNCGKISLKRTQYKMKQLISQKQMSMNSEGANQQMSDQQNNESNKNLQIPNLQQHYSDPVLTFSQNFNEVEGFDKNLIKMSESVYSPQFAKSQFVTPTYSNTNINVIPLNKIPYQKQLSLHQMPQQNFPVWQFHQPQTSLYYNHNHQQHVRQSVNVNTLQKNNINQNPFIMKRSLNLNDYHQNHLPQNAAYLKQSVNVHELPPHLNKNVFQYCPLVKPMGHHQQNTTSLSPSPQLKQKENNINSKMNTLNDAHSILIIGANSPETECFQNNALNDVKLINSLPVKSCDSSSLKDSVNSIPSNREMNNNNQIYFAPFSQLPRQINPVVQSLIIEPGRNNSQSFQNQQNINFQGPLQNRINTPKQVYRSVILSSPIAPNNFTNNFIPVHKQQIPMQLQSNAENQIVSGIPMVLPHQTNQKIIVQRNQYNISQINRPLSSVENQQKLQLPNQYQNYQNPGMLKGDQQIRGNFLKKSQPYTHININQQNYNQNNQQVRLIPISNRPQKQINQIRLAPVIHNFPIIKTQHGLCRPNIITNLSNPQLTMRVPIVQQMVAPGYA